MARRKSESLTVETVRRQRDEAVAEIARLDQKREALLAMVRGHEAWLRVYGPPTASLPPAAEAGSATQGEG